MKNIYILIFIILAIGIGSLLYIDKAPAPVAPEPITQPIVAAPGAAAEEGAPTTFTDSGDDIDGEHIGLIKTISSASLGINYVQWISCADCDDDYMIKNDNPKVRTLKIAPNAKVYLQTYAADDQGMLEWNQHVSLQEFVSIFMNPNGGYPADKLLYWITIKNGEVVRITEQYQP